MTSCDPGTAGVDQRPRPDRLRSRRPRGAARSARPARRARRRATRARVITRAPRAAASRAFSATRRASCTQQSEYSNALRNCGLSARPAGSRVRSRRGCRAGSSARRDGHRRRGRGARSQAGRIAACSRQHEAHRPADVRHRAQQRLALDQRVADQPELVVLKIAQAAVEELGRGRRGRRRKIVHLRQHHRKPAARGVAGDAAAVDPATDDEEIDDRLAVATGRQAVFPRYCLVGRPSQAMRVLSTFPCANVRFRFVREMSGLPEFMLRLRAVWVRSEGSAA